MSTSTALTVTNNAISTLQGFFEAVLPVIIPIVIAVLVLFVGIKVLKGLWHRNV